MTRTRTMPRALAFVVTAALALPTLAFTGGCGSKSNDTAAGTGGYANGPAPAPMSKPGLTTGQKVTLVAGAALLYYLYRRDLKKNAQTASTGANGKPQLYRSKNGGVYYRNPQTHQPVWLTVPQQGMQVNQADLQQYAPDYQQYQGQPAPSAPPGYQTQPFNQYDPSAAGGGYPGGPAGPRGPGM